MFDITRGFHGACDGVTRRDMLRIGTVGALGLSLPQFLKLQSEAKAAGGDAKDDLSVVLIWLRGGLGHIDSFDPKPDAPPEIRGEFDVISTSIPGVQVTEHLPRLAANLDKYSIIRSGYSYNGSHGVADAYMLSGWRFTPSVVYPTFGSVVAKEQGYRKGMPPYVQLGTQIDQRFNGGIAGYIGNQYNPFEVAEDPNAKNFSIDGISLPGGVNNDRFDRRKRMLSQLDRWQSEVEQSSDAVGAMDSFYEKAFGIVTSPEAKRAFALNSEHPKVRDEYGRNRFGQSCLLARRLVQAGVRFVTVTDGGWDTHQNNFTSLERKLPVLDQGYCALLRDLQNQGMLDKTLVLCISDFGRTPKVNPSAGRDHWVGSMVFTLGGGGVKTGEIIGRSNDYAEQPATEPIEIEDIATTMYTLLGIPVDKHYMTPDGRPLTIGPGGRVLTELLA